MEYLKVNLQTCNSRVGFVRYNLGAREEDALSVMRPQ